MSAAAAAQGTLVIVGGGLQPETEAVYRAVLDRMPADGTLGVLPTASGVPEESGPLTVQDFEQYSGPEQKIELIDLRDGEVDKANDPAWAERIAACDALWFTGGDQARIVSTFRHQPVGDTGLDLEDKPDTLAYAAVKSVFEKGGVVGGTSAGAAMMSDPMILWGTLHEALLVGVVNDVPDFGVGVGEGMGLLPRYLVDQHFGERGRLGRLLVAIEGAGRSVGLGIDENTALIVDLKAAETRTNREPSLEVAGTGSVWAVGLSPDLVDVPEKLASAFRVLQLTPGQYSHLKAAEVEGAQQVSRRLLLVLLAGAHGLMPASCLLTSSGSGKNTRTDPCGCWSRTLRLQRQQTTPERPWPRHAPSRRAGRRPAMPAQPAASTRGPSAFGAEFADGPRI